MRPRLDRPLPPPEDPRFQGPDEPYPRHWRRFLVAWPAGATDEDEVRARVRAAVVGLPDTWRAVLLARDADGRSPEQVASDLDLTLSQQRHLLNQARAAVRDAVADLFEPDPTPEPDP